MLSAEDLLRISPISSKKHIYEKVCWGKDKFAFIESSTKQYTEEMKICPLIPTGEPIYTTWATAGIKKNYKYKRTFDIG